MAIDYTEGRNLQTEVLQRMNVDQLNSAATSYRPDLRASKADSLTWVQLWNRSGHMCRASIMDCGDHAHVTLHAE